MRSPLLLLLLLLVLPAFAQEENSLTCEGSLKITYRGGLDALCTATLLAGKALEPTELYLHPVEDAIQP